MEKRNDLDVYFCLEDDMSSIERFLEYGRRQVYKKGSVILPTGVRVNALCYVKKGKAGRLVTAMNGAEKFIKVVCDQCILGEVIFFRGADNEGAFLAIEDCECYFFDEKTVYEVLLRDEQVVRDLIQWFCARMSALNAQVTDGLVKDSHYRVCKFVWEYVQSMGKQDAAGIWVYEGKLSHYDIAKYLGINRVSVTNVMKELQESGVIEKSRTRLAVVDAEYLRAIVEGI